MVRAPTDSAYRSTAAPGAVAVEYLVALVLIGLAIVGSAVALADGARTVFLGQASDLTSVDGSVGGTPSPPLGDPALPPDDGSIPPGGGDDGPPTTIDPSDLSEADITVDPAPPSAANPNWTAMVAFTVNVADGTEVAVYWKPPSQGTQNPMTCTIVNGTCSVTGTFRRIGQSVDEASFSITQVGGVAIAGGASGSFSRP